MLLLFFMRGNKTNIRKSVAMRPAGQSGPVPVFAKLRMTENFYLSNSCH